MTTTKIAVSAAAIVGLLALGTAGYQVNAQREAEASLASARQKHEVLTARLRDLEQRASSAEQTAARRAAAARANVPVDAPAKPADAWDPIAEGAALFARHPDLQPVYQESASADTDFRYGSIYASLGLTPEQIGEFRRLMASLPGKRIWGIIGRKSFAIPNEELPETEVAVRLQSLLGSQGYQHLQEQTPYLDGRAQAARLAAALAFSESPLTTDQAEKFAQIAATSRKPGAGTEGSTKFDWEAIASKAQASLSPPQLKALERLRTVTANNAPSQTVRLP